MPHVFILANCISGCSRRRANAGSCDSATCYADIALPLLTLQWGERSEPEKAVAQGLFRVSAVWWTPLTPDLVHLIYLIQRHCFSDFCYLHAYPHRVCWATYYCQTTEDAQQMRLEPDPKNCHHDHCDYSFYFVTTFCFDFYLFKSPSFTQSKKIVKCNVDFCKHNQNKNKNKTRTRGQRAAKRFSQKGETSTVSFFF